MFSFFYQFGIFFYLVFSLPKILYEWMFLQKKRSDLLCRLGIKKPKFSRDFSKKLFWVHAVSVGEAKAAFFLLEQLKKEHPDAQIVFSTITETGQEEARRAYCQWVDHFLFLPVDFLFSVKRVLKVISPNVIFCVETDLWWSFLSQAKKMGSKIFLVSGKISERSFLRYKKFSFFAKKLFENIDGFYLQNDLYRKRFLDLGVSEEKVKISGNFKYHNLPKLLSEEEIFFWKKKLGINEEEAVFTIASTHFPEEEKILGALEMLFRDREGDGDKDREEKRGGKEGEETKTGKQQEEIEKTERIDRSLKKEEENREEEGREKKKKVKIFLAPRHPERFSSVEKLLQKKGISYSLFEPLASATEVSSESSGSLILVNKMGALSLCFQLSDFAIVGGSFVEGIGGHNILEPVFFKKFVFFGPHMEKQVEMRDVVVEKGFGKEVRVEDLLGEVEGFLDKKNALMKNNLMKKKRAFEGSVEVFMEEVEAGKERSLQFFKNF